MTVGEKILVVLGIFVAVFGLIITAGGLISLFEAEDTMAVPAELTLIFLLGVFPFFCGAWLCRHAWIRAATRRQEKRERELLILAAKMGGKLTEAEVTMNLSVNSVEAEKMLATAHRNGLAEIEVTESGCIVYHFRGIVTKREKETSQSF